MTTNMPLSGLKVVELSGYVAGPATTRMLSDYGADVIKVEDLYGDPWRTVGAAYCTNGAFNDPEFSIGNSGKKLVSLNLKTEAGMEAMMKLVSEADIFVTSFRLPALQKMGLDYDTLKEKYPTLIYGHLTGLGYDGPDAERAGYDIAAFWARTGPLVDWLEKGAHPIVPTIAFGDMATATMLVSGILMALHSRDVNGKGTLVETSLYGTSIWYNGFAIVDSQPQYRHKYPQNPATPPTPFGASYQCKDGEWINFAIVAYEAMKEKMAKVFGMEKEFDDPRAENTIVMTMSGYLPEIVEKISAVFKTKTCDEWCEIFNEQDIVYERLMHFKDVSKDPQAWANNYLENVQFKDVTTAMPATPLRFPEFEKRHYMPLGGVGEDTEEVLTSIGYSTEEIAAMKENKEVR